MAIKDARLKSVSVLESDALTGPAGPAPLQVAPDSHEVAWLAYRIWDARGREGGSPEGDWYEAERELRERPASTA